VEAAFLDRAVDLVGADQDEALQAVAADAVQQDLGAAHVGGDEARPVVDRAVHVGLGGQVQAGLGALHGPVHRLRVGDAALHEAEAGVALPAGQVLAASGVGQRVQHGQAAVGATVKQVVDQVGADETGSTGD